MDIDKVRGLTDAELEVALREAKQELARLKHPSSGKP